jgi:hypothetical protein
MIESAKGSARGATTMRKSNVPTIRRDLIQITKELYALSHSTSDPERALRLARAADLLIEARGVELYRMR